DLTDELRRRIAAVQGANRSALISRRSDLPPADGLITSPGTAAYTPSQPLPQPADAAPQPQSTAAAAGGEELPPAPPGYEVLGVLGRGAMGVVYRARQTRLNRLVALKMILSGAHASPEERVRFVAEADAVAALNHPGIVQVYEAGTQDGLPYF